VNQSFEQRLRRLEELQEPRPSKKRIAPDWLLDHWHEETGLPFDTDEEARDSIRRMQQPEYRDRRRNTAPAPSSDGLHNTRTMYASVVTYER
jgi:hypothetical protein